MAGRIAGQPTYDLTGKQFGKLTALYWVKEGKIKWVCECECGNYVAILTGNLLRGDRSSCGCGHDRNPNGHRMSGTRTYTIWQGMKARCNNPNDTGYKWYGAKGIKVCERWNKFENFLADMGECPEDYQIDRILNDGDYCKDNCRWATNKQNSNNREGSDLSVTLQDLTEEQLENLLRYLREG